MIVEWRHGQGSATHRLLTCHRRRRHRVAFRMPEMVTSSHRHRRRRVAFRMPEMVTSSHRHRRRRVAFRMPEMVTSSRRRHRRPGRRRWCHSAQIIHKSTRQQKSKA